MKKLIIGAALIAVVASSAANAATRVLVFKGDAKLKISVDDLKTESVCSFKKKVADKFDLKMKKFELRKSGIRLNEDKTLSGAGIHSGTKIEVKDVSHSFQCT